MSWNQRLFYEGLEGRGGVVSASIITIRMGKKKINLPVTEKKRGSSCGFCVEQSDSGGGGSDGDKCSRNGVLLPHKVIYSLSAPIRPEMGEQSIHLLMVY